MSAQTRNAVAALSYPQRQRLQFLESVAFWEGSVKRQRVCAAFDVSPNHITKDLRRYKAISPNNLVYDVAARVYRPTSRFRPVVSTGRPEEYLGLLRFTLEAESFAGIPDIESEDEVAALPVPHWPADPEPLRAVLRAIREGLGVEAEYQSLRTAKPNPRILWPHALLFAGHRWHVRAYDSRRELFLDFVLPRISRATIVQTKSPQPAAADDGWTEVHEVLVVPSSHWKPRQKEVIAKEYGMEKTANGWCWSAKMRRCLVPYFLHAHQLKDPPANARVVAKNISALRHLAFSSAD